MSKIIQFFKSKYNLTFTALGVLIFILVVSSLIWGVNFALLNINKVFEEGVATSTVITHFNFQGFDELLRGPSTVATSTVP